jgi:ABC-type multidrug transport system permease subunit
MLPLIILPLMLFGGFYKNRKDLPVWIGWIEYLSPIKYSFTSLATNEYQGTTAPISLLNFDTSMWESIGILIALSLFARFVSIFVLWVMRSKLQ